MNQPRVHQPNPTGQPHGVSFPPDHPSGPHFSYPGSGPSPVAPENHWTPNPGQPWNSVPNHQVPNQQVPNQQVPAQPYPQQFRAGGYPGPGPYPGPPAGYPARPIARYPAPPPTAPKPRKRRLAVVVGLAVVAGLAAAAVVLGPGPAPVRVPDTGTIEQPGTLVGVRTTARRLLQQHADAPAARPVAADQRGRGGAVHGPAHQPGGRARSRYSPSEFTAGVPAEQGRRRLQPASSRPSWTRPRSATRRSSPAGSPRPTPRPGRAPGRSRAWCSATSRSAGRCCAERRTTPGGFPRTTRSHPGKPAPAGRVFPMFRPGVRIGDSRGMHHRFGSAPLRLFSVSENGHYAGGRSKCPRFSWMLSRPAPSSGRAGRAGWSSGSPTELCGATWQLSTTEQRRRHQVAMAAGLRAQRAGPAGVHPQRTDDVDPDDRPGRAGPADDLHRAAPTRPAAFGLRGRRRRGSPSAMGVASDPGRPRWPASGW